MTSEELKKRKREVEEAGSLIHETDNEHFGKITDPRRIKSGSSHK